MISRRALNLFLIIILVILLSTIVRYLPIVEYSSQPVSYAGGNEFSLDYLLNTGHFLTTSEANKITSNNAFSQGINEYSTYPLLPSLYATISLVLGIEPFTLHYNIIISIVFLLPLIAIYFSIFNKFSNFNKNKNARILAVTMMALIVLLYSQLASPGAITQAGAQGHIFMLFPIFLVFLADTKDIRIKFLSIFFVCIFLAVYNTAASFFLLWLLMATFYLVSKKKQHAIIGVVTIYVVAYLTYSIYVSAGRGTTFFQVFENFINIFMEGSLYFEPSSMALPSEYLVNTSEFNKIKYVVDAVLVILPILYYITIGNKFIKQRPLNNAPLISGIAALPVLAILLYLWLGGLSLGRLQEYGTVMSILIVCAILPIIKEKHMKVLATCLALAVIVSCVTYITDENTPYRRITINEQIGANWLINESLNDRVFTDHRLSGTLIGNGLLNTTGVYEKDTLNQTLHKLNSIYYRPVTNDAYGVIKGTGSSYVLFSKEMTKEAPGIMIYNYPIKNATSDFLNYYDWGMQFDNIYSNSVIKVYLV